MDGVLDYDEVDRLLRNKKMSHRQLAIAAGISPNTLQSWFTRRTEKIPPNSINAMASVLEIDEVQILASPEILRRMGSGVLGAWIYHYDLRNLQRDILRLPLNKQKEIIDEILSALEEEAQCHEGEKKTIQEASPLCPDDQSPIGSK